MDRVAFHVFWVCSASLLFLGGVTAGYYRLFPSQVVSAAEDGFEQLFGKPEKQSGAEFRKCATGSDRPASLNTPRACPGVNLVTHITTGEVLSVKLMGNEGSTLHKWIIDWFTIWPDAAHVPAHLTPRSRPGTHVHRAALLPNGNLVFNFEKLGLVCLDPRGNVVWRLPHQTHHSVTLADDGNLWVCGIRTIVKPLAAVPNLKVPFYEDTILEVTPDGKIARE